MTYPTICIICYVTVSLIKRTKVKNELLPLISGGIGAALALIATLAFPQLMHEGELLTSLVGGILSGLAATGGNQVLKQATKLICERHGIDSAPFDPIVDAAEELLDTDNE